MGLPFPEQMWILASQAYGSNRPSWSPKRHLPEKSPSTAVGTDKENPVMLSAAKHLEGQHDRPFATAQGDKKGPRRETLRYRSEEALERSEGVTRRGRDRPGFPYIWLTCLDVLPDIHVRPVVRRNNALCVVNNAYYCRFSQEGCRHLFHRHPRHIVD